MYVMLICLIPLFIPVAYWLWKRPHADMAELAIASVAGVVVAAICYGIGFKVMTNDSEIWNGRVTAKEQERVSCEHSYSCMCTTDSNGHQTCQTCYDHAWDYDWVLHTNIGSNIIIDRIDRQGTDEPPRFTKAKIGDSVAVEHTFTNYLKPAEESLFNDSKMNVERFKDILPKYPGHIFDYHYINRVIPIKVPLPDLESWNRELSERLITLGPQKQANIVIVMVNNPDSQYADALRAHWLGGKKNDIVVVLGVTEYPKISWVSVVSWTDRELFKVTLRESLMRLGTIENREKVLNVIERDTITLFQRKNFEDFSYLSEGAHPPFWAMVLAIFLGCLGSIISIGVIEHQRTRSGYSRRNLRFR